ncbi:MAG: hypothetical protein IPP35_00620 [Elusimicrobia bacterium]|nr:hypothetical protein [Elusimicrobiota bacterium]
MKKAVLHAVTESERSGATFDRLGGLTGYKESMSQRDGLGCPAGGSILHRENIKFHPLGQMRSYDGDETRADSPDITTELHWTGTFDRYMRSAGALERKTEHLAGGGTGVETTTVRNAVGYDDFGQMVSYTETVDRSDAPDALTTVVWENGLFDGGGNLEGYRETTKVAAKGPGTGLDNTKTVERRGTTYDGYGLLAAFEETTTDTAQPAVYVTTTRQATSYDLMGREMGSVSLRHDAGAAGAEISVPDKWTTLVQDGRKYNDVGLATGYREASFDGQSLSLGGREQAWKSLSAVQQRDILSGTLAAAEAVTLTSHQGISYDGRGLAVGYMEKTWDLSVSLDHHRGTVRTGAVYNSQRQLVGYTDVLTDDASPDVVETLSSSGGTYNGFGQMIHSFEVREQSGALVSRTEGDRRVEYDEEGRVAAERKKTVSANGIAVDRDYEVVAFDDFGRVLAERTKTVQTGVAQDGRQVYEITTTSNKTEMGYDRNGRLNHSVEAKVSSDRPDVSVRTVWDAETFNENNLMGSSNETKVETNPAGTNQTTTSRTGLTYDLKGRTTAYRDTIADSADKITEVLNWTGLGFDGAGLVTGLSEVRRRTSGDSENPFDVTTTLRKEGMGYDQSGNLRRYTQKSSGTENPDLISSVSWFGAYDSLNRLSGFKETTLNTDVGTEGQVFKVNLVTVRDGNLYDDQNHLIGYAQISTDALGNDSSVLWAGLYDGRGLVEQFEEKTIDAQVNLTVKSQKDITYDAAARVQTFNQKVTDPLGTVTDTTREETAYNTAGLLGSMRERANSLDAGGVRTVTTNRQGPTRYDSSGHLAQRHDDLRTAVYDTDGTLKRETNQGEDLLIVAYNGLGQDEAYTKTVVTTSPDGLLNQKTTGEFSKGKFNLIGQLVSSHQKDVSAGSSVEPLVLPSNWDDLALQPEQKVEWLKNLTFVVEGVNTSFDDLGLAAPSVGGLEIAWKDLSAADRVRLLSEGKTMLNGKPFSLDGSLIRWDLNTLTEYDQSHTTYSKYGATSGYQRSGTENGVGYTQTWDALGFDRHNRAMGFTDFMARQGQAATTTTRENIVYDVRSLVATYRDTLTSAASPDLVTQSQATVRYDALKRQKLSQQTVTQKGRTAKGEVLDTMQTVVDDHYTYNGFDKTTGYDEIKFQGNTLALGDARRSWDSLDADEKARLFSGEVKPDDQILTIIRISGVAYNAAGLQSGSINITRDLGRSLVETSPLVISAPLNLDFPSSLGALPVQPPRSIGPNLRVLADGSEQVGPFSRLLADGSREERGITTFSNGEISNWLSVTIPDGPVLAKTTTADKDGKEISESFSAVFQDGTILKETEWADGSVEKTESSPSAEGGVRTRGTTTSAEGDISVWESSMSSDGSTQTRTLTPEGAVVETRSQTRSNGKVETFSRTTSADGSEVSESVTIKNPDGSADEWARRRTGDGAIEETTTQFHVDGSSKTWGKTTPRGGKTYNWTSTKDSAGKIQMVKDSEADSAASVVVFGATFDSFNRQMGRTEVAWDQKAEGQIVSTNVHDIHYNDQGQQTGFISDLKKWGVDLELFETIQREGMVYNTLGQVAGYVDQHTANGLQNTTTMMDITYDSQGRMTGSTGIAHKEGQEPRWVYSDPAGGKELSGADLAALLSAHPKKTVGDLVRENVVRAENRIFQVNETVRTVMSDIQYDSLNRVKYSKETVTNADHTQTVNVLSEMYYDLRGRLVGSETTTRVTGSVGQLIYQLKGADLSAAAMSDLLQSESAKTGKTANDVFWSLFRAGDLRAVEVAVNMDRTSANKRSDIRYNANGQMIHYEDTMSDPDNGVLKQVTKADLTYNRKGQMLTQTSAVHADMKGSGWSDSTSVMSLAYDDRTGLLLGGTTTSNSTTQPRKEWTDTNQDGKVDRLMRPPQVKGKSEQHFGVFNGAVQLNDQTSSQETWGYEVAGKTWNKNENTMVFIYNALGRSLGAISAGTSETNDGYNNLTTGSSTQLFVAINGEQRIQASLSDTTAKNADGSDSHTVMTNLYAYDSRAHVTGAQGEGYTSGNEVGTIDPEHVWNDGWVDANHNGLVEDGEVDGSRADGVRDAKEVVWVDTNKDGMERGATVGRTGGSSGSISQEYKVINNEARLIKNTSISDNTSETGSTSAQTLVTTYRYDENGRLTGGQSTGTTGSTTLDWSDGPPKALVKSSTANGTVKQTFVVINGALKLKVSHSKIPKAWT